MPVLAERSNSPEGVGLSDCFGDKDWDFDAGATEADINEPVRVGDMEPAVLGGELFPDGMVYPARA